MREMIVALVVVTAACVSSKPAATKDVAIIETGRPVSDLDSAAFESITIDGQKVGEVAIWSNGAHVTDGKNGERLGVLEFEMLVRNLAKQPLELDLAQTNITFQGEPRQTIEPELAIAGRRRIAGGDIQRLGIRYRLPSANTVERLLGFDFAWAFGVPTGQRSAHVTSFRLPATAHYEAAEWMPVRYVIYPYEGRKPWSMTWSEVRDDGPTHDRSVTFPPAQQQFQVKDRANKPTEGDSPNG